MSGIRSLRRAATVLGSATAGSAPIYVDSDSNEIKCIVAGSGTTEVTLVDTNTTQTLTNKTISLPASIADDSIFGIGTDSDTVLYNRSTILGANTAITSVVVGTPVTPAIAANSLILSNVTASGDVLLALNNGGNSQAWLWVDSSAGLMQLFGAGVPVLETQATLVEIPDLILFTLGNDNDQVLLNKSTSTLADTAITGALIGTPVTDALAANSLIISNITASGDILVAANRGGNSEEYLFVDSSVGVLYLSGLAGGISLALATDQPAPDLAGEAVHIWDGSAGAVTALTDSRLIIESNDATANYINMLSPTAAVQGLVFGDTTNERGSIKYDHATDRLSLTAAGSTSQVVLNANGDFLATGGLYADTRSSTAVSTDSNQIYTIANLLTGIITRTGITANRTDAVDTAANIVGGIPGAVAGQSFLFIVNNNDDSHTVAVTGASAGVTYEGSGDAIAIGDCALFMAVLTNVTGASEAVTIYQLGSGQ